MSRTREEHLQWCKDRALEYARKGDKQNTVASMLSDLGKWDEPLYDPYVMQLMTQDGMFFRNTSRELEDWVIGFN